MTSIHQRPPKQHNLTKSKEEEKTVESANGGSLKSAWIKLIEAYNNKTPSLIKSLDCYLLFCFATGIIQLIYCGANKGKHYQSFLGGFIACVGSFVLTANVRMQLDGPGGLDDRLLRARVTAEYVLGHIVLYLLVANFIS